MVKVVVSMVKVVVVVVRVIVLSLESYSNSKSGVLHYRVALEIAWLACLFRPHFPASNLTLSPRYLFHCTLYSTFLLLIVFISFPLAYEHTLMDDIPQVSPTVRPARALGSESVFSRHLQFRIRIPTTPHQQPQPRRHRYRSPISLTPFAHTHILSFPPSLQPSSLIICSFTLVAPPMDNTTHP
jgi:hypothetical protein